MAQSLIAVKEKSWDLNSSVLALGPLHSLKAKVFNPSFSATEHVEVAVSRHNIITFAFYFANLHFLSNFVGLK